MGIDARILLRVKGPRPEESQLKLWSWSIANALGSENFFISKDGKYNDGKPHGAIGYTLSCHRDANDPQPGTAYYQDGPEIIAEPGETFLEVRVWTRYYGEGYERGDLLFLCAVAEWCETNIPGVEVWYGGDSSGVVAEPWPEAKRRAMRRHLFSPLGREYFGMWNSMSKTGPNRPQPCVLCVGAGSFNSCGFGPKWEKVHCSGCGDYFETTDGGKTWKPADKDKMP